jgi:type VI secretion system protein ImpJ
VDYFQKVLWSEGLFLTPQHLQQQDRYHEGLLERRLKGLEPFGWGVADMKIDEDALSNGELVVSRCSAVLTDGLIIDFPDFDEPPPPRQIAPLFEARKGTLAVYLGAPAARPGRAAARLEEDTAAGSSGGPTRYRRKFVKIIDDSAGSNERDVACAVKDVSLLLEGEPIDDHVTIKVAEIEKTATGAFRVRESYVPPSLFISASPHLMTIVRRIVEILSAKSEDLAKQRRQRAQGLVEFTMSEAANFWFLHTVNGYIPALLHYFHRPKAHPERVYLELARLAGELYTFASEGHPKEAPAYAHDDLSGTFTGLEELLRGLLETVIPTRCTPIPLERTRESLYTGRVPDERMLDLAQFYLAVMANVPDEKVVKEVPLKAKISSLDRVDRLITQALKGIALKHLPSPPAEIPVQPGRNYFQVEKRGEHWDAVKASRSVSIYLPPEFTDLKLELMAVKE